MGPLIRRARLISLSLGVDPMPKPCTGGPCKNGPPFFRAKWSLYCRLHFEYSLLSHRALPGLVEARGARRARPKEFLPRQTHGKNELDFFCFANSARRCDAGADIIRPRRGGSISCRSPANSHRVFLLSRRGRRPRRPMQIGSEFVCQSPANPRRTRRRGPFCRIFAAS